MSVLDQLMYPRDVRRLGTVVNRVQEDDYADLPPLSVYLDGGVVPRSERSDNYNQLGSDLGRYQRVLPGDLVFNRLRTWQGGFGASRHKGIVSPAYIVARPSDGDARYLDYVLHSAPYLAELTRISKWMPPSQFDVLWSDLRGIEVPWPKMEEQRRIADFLDEHASRIDRIICARRAQIDLASESHSRLSFDMVRGVTIQGERRHSQLEWLGNIPSSWGVLSVGSQFTVELGKMLDEKRQTGSHRVPYLRNANVQWDQVSTDDLKEMDIPDEEYSRYTVKAGDLLICEGGQPGRGAIWEGGVEPLGFQKALHRARSRGRSLSKWLLECLRVAVELNVFAAASGQTTIAHLTNEQLRSQRFPFPDPNVQARLLSELEEQQVPLTSIMNGLGESIDFLSEYKSSLITAAVTGELDVPTAGSSALE